MKIGMNLLLWNGFIDETHFGVMADIRKAGYDGVEIPLFAGDAAHYTKVRKELDKLGLLCTTVTVLDEKTSAISPDAAVRKASVERLQWAIEMNAILGSKSMCGPFHSPLAVFTGQGPTDDEKKRAVEVLSQAAEIAKKNDVTLCIEYLNRFECYFLTTAVDAAKLVKSVNHPNFRTMFDTFHANIEEKSQAAGIKAVADVMGHVHISENDRGVPGTGQVHWDEAFRTLREVKYDGWLVIEAFGRALPDLAAATRVWRDLFPDAKDVYEHGIRFIRDKWAEAGKK